MAHGRRLPPKKGGEKLSDEKRDHAAALAAYDYFVEAMPPEVQETIRQGRDGIIEMLMDSGGHQPRLN